MQSTIILQTTRLQIRELELIDTDNINTLLSLPETDEFNTLGIPETIQDTKAIVQKWLERKNKRFRRSYVFCIEQPDTKQFIGLIALNLSQEKYKAAEVWYKTHLNYWRRGYTTEALIRLLDFGFNNLKLHRIEAGCAVENIASIKVLEKAGMIREGNKRKKLPIRGEWIDSYFYAILEEDFDKEMSIKPFSNNDK